MQDLGKLYLILDPWDILEGKGYRWKAPKVLPAYEQQHSCVCQLRPFWGAENRSLCPEFSNLCQPAVVSAPTVEVFEL